MTKWFVESPENGAYHVRRMEKNSANYIDTIWIFYLRVLENWPLARLDLAPF